MTRDQEIAWAAGLFEGEGSICYSFNSSSWCSHHWIAQLGMTDEDAVRRFHEAVGGIGNVNVRKPRDRNGTHRKTLWNWKCSKQDDLLAFVSLMGPLLCARRQRSANDCLHDLARHHELFEQILAEQKR